MHSLQFWAMSSVSLSMQGHQKYERAILFILDMPILQKCSSVKINLQNLVGIITL